MKVLIITTVRFRTNGITSVIMNYYKNIDKKNISIDFVIPNKINYDCMQEFENNGSKVYCIERKKKPIKYFIKLYKLMYKNKYDIVHVHGNSSMMLIDILPSVLAKVPVRIVHSHNTTCSHKVLHKILLPLFSICYTQGVACGQEAGKWLFGNKEFVELKNGIELNDYKFDSKIRKIYREKIRANNSIVIGHIGNFVEQKNHSFLLDWFAELFKENKNYMLLLISDGELMDSMKLKADKLGVKDNVIFLGKSTEVPQYLQAMDLFVLPSLYEGLPVVLVEAQAAGLPCIVSEKVDRQVNLTNQVKFLNIDDTRIWVDNVKKISEQFDANNRSEVCEKWQKKITEAGYDITQNANLLKNMYLENLNSNK